MTVCTLGVLNGVAHVGAGIVVLGAAIAVTAARPGRGALRHRAVGVALSAVGVAAVALIFGTWMWAIDALFVLAVLLGTAARAFGGGPAVAGQSVMSAFLAFFIAPVAPGAHPVVTVGWALVAAAVAYGWTLLASVGEPEAEPEAEPDDEPKLPVHMWRAVRAALSIALAFVLGGALFPGHQVWAVIAAFVIGVGTTSRGEAVLRGTQRTFGALLGTVGATLLADAVNGRPLLSVVLMLVFLGIGFSLRQVNYLFWAPAVTSVLALLYGLNGPADTATLLRQRVLAGLLGAACAIAPALFLAPIRTRALVRKRAGTALRSLGAALRGEPDGAAALARRAEHDIAALRTAAAPLLAIRRFRPSAEATWADGLTAALPDLRALPDAAAKHRLARTTRQIAAEVRTAARPR